MAPSSICPVITVTDWRHAKTLFETTLVRWIFRGQSSSALPLTTSLERAADGLSLATSEAIVLEVFKRQAHHFVAGDVVRRDHIMDWLALMQHHGAPTRLLDWSHSPYIATFFALENARGAAGVWAMDPYWCLDIGLTRLRASIPSFSALPAPASWSDENYLDAVFSGVVAGVFPVEPFHLNERLRVQQGLFLLPGASSQSFEENILSLAGNLADHMLMIEIPAAVRIEALTDLQRMNVSRVSLFPGLDGFAQSLKLLLDIANAETGGVSSPRFAWAWS